MALVNGPLFSLDASGKLGDAIVFTKWKGRPVVRQYVIPANPRTIDQSFQRQGLALYTKLWQLLSPAQKATWQSLADAASISTFNAMMRYNLDRMSDDQSGAGTADGSGPGQDLQLDTLTLYKINSTTIRAVMTIGGSPNENTVVFVTLSEDGGANSTAYHFDRVIGSIVNLDGDGNEIVIEVPNLPPGTWRMAGNGIGIDGETFSATAGQWVPADNAITLP